MSISKELASSTTTLWNTSSYLIYRYWAREMPHMVEKGEKKQISEHLGLYDYICV